MREIKFRAWDKTTKGFLDENDNVPNFLNLVPCDTTGEFSPMYMYIETTSDIYGSDCILMQYTGLKDKNGKEIYEGDIVKDGWLKGMRPFVVEWKTIQANSDSSTWYPGTGFNVALDKDSPNTYEVIGNIYENPELLEN